MVILHKPIEDDELVEYQAEIYDGTTSPDLGSILGLSILTWVVCFVNCLRNESAKLSHEQQRDIKSRHKT